MTTRTPTPTRLDQDTPKWPEVRIGVGETVDDPTTVTVSGVITPVADHAAAIARAAEQARALGRPIRVRVTTTDGLVLHRLIVTAGAAVTTLDQPPPTRDGHGGVGGNKPAKARGRTGGKGILGRFPARLRPVIRWGAPALGILVAASLLVLVLHGRGDTAEAGGPQPVAPIPPGGQLYTEHAPPGWSQNADWVIDLAKHAPAPVAAADGTVVAITTEDHSAAPATGDDRYLSALAPDGRTRWAVPLDTVPRVGPLVVDVDGAPVVAVADTRDLTYWPLTGGPATVVPLPAGAKVTPTGMVTLPNNRLGYLHAGALQTVDGLPRTEPGIALDGAVLVTQPDDGAWWTLSAGTAPTAVQPTAPPGAAQIDRVLAVDARQVLIGWATPDPRACIVAAYQRQDGTLTATTTAPCSALPRNGAAYTSNGNLAGVGPIIQTGGTLLTVPGLTVTTVVDQIYGTTTGHPAVVTAAGQITKLPAGTLIPIGQTPGHLLVVGSTGHLYALNR